MDLGLLIIGGGTAGMNAAKEAHKLGARNLAIVEQENFAGTCLARG
jgi:pyruvate/2-oxoglutarate dehydrogenase complex dihydrolipoamide dehydrogenase (E3) component